MAPAGTLVTLTNNRPHRSGGPEPGDVLETSTGRRYLIDQVHPLSGHRARYRCLVMDVADPYPVGSVRFAWKWDRRRRAR